MKGYRVQFEAEIDVKFEDPEKAQAYYVDGSWSKSFWELDDLKDLADSIASSFNYEDDKYDKKSGSFFTRFVEGFGLFVQQKDGDEYLLSPEFSENGGQIRVRYNAEIETSWTTELKNVCFI